MISTGGTRVSAELTAGTRRRPPARVAGGVVQAVMKPPAIGGKAVKVGAVALAPLSAQEAPRGVHLFQVHLNVLAWLDRSGIEKHMSQCRL
jgi:hypothetical protein